jgi:hypothetical protein
MQHGRSIKMKILTARLNIILLDILLLKSLKSCQVLYTITDRVVFCALAVSENLTVSIMDCKLNLIL